VERTRERAVLEHARVQRLQVLEAQEHPVRGLAGRLGLDVLAQDERPEDGADTICGDNYIPVEDASVGESDYASVRVLPR
jgi:hypothetical protein